MSRPNDLAARAAKLSTRQPQKAARAAAAEPAPATKPAAAPRVKPVRLSLDLAPQSYRSLKLICDELAVELGRARVTQSEVMRAMVTLLDEAPAVRQALTDAIRDER